jgi:dihydropteroate synthase
MIEEGADIIDIGGESTRPGALPASVTEELDRVIPVIEALRRESPVFISVDTSKPEVMRAAVQAGADIINDVRALTGPGALAAAAGTRAGVCLMHMLGEPRTMQVAPSYGDVVAEVSAFLAARMAACRDAGIDAARIAIDPGFGFGKRLVDNLTLLKHLARFQALGAALAVGLSRKSMLAKLTGRDVDERTAGSVALAAIAVLNGARIVRAHDVAATIDAIRVAAAVVQGVGFDGT